MAHYITAQGTLPAYIMFPRFLLTQPGLNETAKLAYILLLDRARLSLRHPQWVDGQGRAFLVYPVAALAKNMGKSQMTVKTALRTLEQEGLLERRRRGLGQANLLYVKLPEVGERESIPPPGGTKTCGAEGEKTTGQRDENLSTNKNYLSQTTVTTTREQSERTHHGCFGNVMLSLEEVARLTQEVPDWEDYVDKLSAYMKSTGKRYQDHAATLRSWALRDRPKRRTYQCQEEESL